MVQVEALVTPSVMCWAREQAGLNIIEVASKLKCSKEEIKAWELGFKKPTISQARKASETYRRPFAAFYLPEPPLKFDTLRDFRRLPNEEERTFGRDLLELIRTATEHQNWVIDFLDYEGVPALPFIGTVELNDKPKDIADKIFKLFDISPEEQSKTQSRYYALKLWIDKIESKGVFIFRKGSIDLRSCRGFALSNSVAPFIFLNSDDAYAAMMFTLIHELAHLFLNLSGVSNIETNGIFVTHEDLTIEQFCNQVASETLIYADIFDKELKKLNISWTLEERIEKLSQIFKVSEEAMARRLLQYNYISNLKYNELREYYQDRWIELKELEEQKAKKREGGPSYYTVKISQNGLLYTQTVISAYMGGRIAGRDASSLLDVKLNRLPKLAEKAGIPTSVLNGLG